MKMNKFFMMAVIAAGASVALVGCDEQKSTFNEKQIKYYINVNTQVKNAADNYIRSTDFTEDVRFEFAKIKKVHPTYYIACYLVTENGRNYQGGFHVMKRGNEWQVVDVTLDWDVLD